MSHRRGPRSWKRALGIIVTSVSGVDLDLIQSGRERHHTWNYSELPTHSQSKRVSPGRILFVHEQGSCESKDYVGRGACAQGKEVGSVVGEEVARCCSDKRWNDENNAQQESVSEPVGDVSNGLIGVERVTGSYHHRFEALMENIRHSSC